MGVIYVCAWKGGGGRHITGSVGMHSQLGHILTTMKLQSQSETPNQFLPSLNQCFMSTMAPDPQEIVAVRELTPTPGSWGGGAMSQKVNN